MSEGVRLYAGTPAGSENRALFAGFCNVVRGHASGSGGAGDLMVRRNMGKSLAEARYQLTG